MVGGGLVAAGFMVGLPMAGSVVTVAIVWLAVQLGVNALQAAATALVPDRYPPARRGGVSGMVGLGITVGNAVGAIVAGSLAAQGALPYLVLAVLMVVVVGTFVVVNRDSSSVAAADEVREPVLAQRRSSRGFWVNPRRHPDFAWAFASRFLMVIGFYGAQTYGLYILRDYVGLSDTESTAVAAQIGVVLLVGVLISALGQRLCCRTRSVGASPSSSGPRSSWPIALAVPLFVPTVTGVLVYSFLLGLGFGTYISIDLALMTEVLPATAGERAEQPRAATSPSSAWPPRCRRR